MGLKVASIDGGAGRLQEDGSVVFGFSVVDGGGAELHRFEARYSQLRALHDALHVQGVFELFGVQHSGGMFSSTFPPSYPLRDMKTPENRAIRGAELQSYLSTMLLAHPEIWQQDDVLNALNVDKATGVTVATAIHQEMGGLSGGAEGEDTLAGAAQRTIPAHFRGRWLHDDRSDDVEPLVAAAGLSWMGHSAGQEKNPPVELFFTDTHLVVVEGDEDLELDDKKAGLAEAAVGAMTGKKEGTEAGLVTNKTYATLEKVAGRFHGEKEGPVRGNVTLFLLSGEEEVCTRLVKGEEEKVSTKYWSNGEVIKTWTWLWDPKGKQKRCAIVSERQVTGKSVLYAPSFKERVCFLPLDSPTVPVVTLERHMGRDVKHTPRALPESLQARAWRPTTQVANVSSSSSNGSSPPAGTDEQAPAIAKQSASASKQVADEARLRRVANMTNGEVHRLDDCNAEAVALLKLREKDALLAAKQAEAQRAEEAEAEKAALLADALKRTAALQEQIEKLSAAAAAAAAATTAASTNDSNEQKALTREQPSDAASRVSGISSSASQQRSRSLSSPRPNFSPTRRGTSTPRASGDGKKRRARQPLEMLEHGDLGCATEWWQPGSKGGPDARLEDILGRAALASGDPKGTLEKLILNSKTKSLKSELDGMGERELEGKARNLGITALDILKAMASDAGCTDEEIARAVLDGETDPTSSSCEKLKQLIRDHKRNKIEAQKRGLESKARGLGITVDKLMETEAAQMGFCLGDVQVKACLDGGQGSDTESIWISAATNLTREVCISGPIPPAVAKRPSPTGASGSPVDALLNRVLDLQQRGQTDTEPWVETWRIGAAAMRDHDGELLVHELAQLLRTSGTVFMDPSFPHTDDSIFGSDSSPGDFLGGAQGVEWRRASDIGAVSGQSLSTVVFADDLDPDDIVQGQVGDCYFLAALASLASAENDHLLKDLIIEDGMDMGIFGIKLFMNGHWVTVIVDDWFPCIQDDSGVWQPLFARSNHHSNKTDETVVELWVMVFEKAWAKLHGSYRAIEGGFTDDALNYLTGGRAFRFDFSPGSDDWDHMVSLLKRGSEHETKMAFLTAEISTAGGHSSAELLSRGLCAGHAYSVLDAIELPTGERLIHLRNPWGKFEWNGPWCDSDPRWTPETRSFCRMAAQKDGKHLDDGAFYMNLEDFKTFFCSVGVCDPFELAAVDTSGDGLLDTAIVSGIRVGAGDTATVECGLATELQLEAYQKDVRGKPTPFKKVKVSVKCSALGDSWFDAVAFSCRTYSQTISLDMKALNVGSRVPVRSSPPSEDDLIDMLLPDDGDDHGSLEGLIIAKAQEDLITDLDKLDLNGLKGAAVEAAKENGGDTDEMEKEAAAIGADEDPTGLLATLIVEHANLMERFKMSGWSLEMLRQKARELGFTDEKIAATEAVGESNPDSNPKQALLQLILDGLSRNMRLRLKDQDLGALLDEAKEEGLDMKKVQKALDSDNPKEALLAMILELTKAAEGSQMVEIDSPAVKQGRVPQQQAALPSRHRRRTGSAQKKQERTPDSAASMIRAPPSD